MKENERDLIKDILSQHRKQQNKKKFNLFKFFIKNIELNLENAKNNY